MNDQDIIRKAVELADGWKWYGTVIDVPVPLNPVSQKFGLPAVYLDALAAQLVRQVNSTKHSEGGFDVEIDPYMTRVRKWKVGSPDRGVETVSCCDENDDPTMNTLRAIVESGVLSDVD